MQSIMILGDSTSMAVGFEKKLYPFILEGRKTMTEDTDIINCSQPGFTASDACAFFFKYAGKTPRLKALIIYIGNCDANASEIKKGRYTPLKHFRDILYVICGIKVRRARLKNRLLRFEWNDAYDPSLEAEESAADYEYNLKRIIGYCARASIPVILIKPVANLLFPSGVGKGNFAFYKYINMSEFISDRISIRDRRFLEAIKSQESGRYEEAMERYNEILISPRSESMNGEYDLMVVNNYAVCTAHLGRFTESEKLFKLLLKERLCRHEIVMYNLAYLYRMAGKDDLFNEWIVKSYEKDASLYRIKNGYRHIIDKLAKRFQQVVRVLPMEEFTRADMFIDHCHLTPEGQGILADRIAAKLAELGLMSRQGKAVIRNRLYNPELALGNDTEFYEYYRSYAPYGRADINAQIEKIRKISPGLAHPDAAESELHFVSKEVRNAVSFWLRHPCFTSAGDIVRFDISYQADVGRFPEFFIYRILIPYLRMLERDKTLMDRFDDDLKILHKSADFMSILPLPVAGLVTEDSPKIDAVADIKWLDGILAKVRRTLLAHLNAGNKVHERIKTTIFWYFRETLRWGSHSRTSMRYDRLFLESAAEALAVASVLDLKLAASRHDEIVSMIRWVEEAVRIHERYASRYSLSGEHAALLAEYDKALRALAGSIERDHNRKVSIQTSAQ